VANIHRLVQVDEITGLPQPVEELTEILLHPRSPKSACARVVGELPISY